MLLHALRRWFARHPTQWVLGVALGLTLTLGGAQLAAACHEIAHVAAQTASGAPDAHANAGHDCPICLLAAAIGGAATTSVGLTVHASDAAVTVPQTLVHDFTPRFARIYASRAPPVPAAIAA